MTMLRDRRVGLLVVASTLFVSLLGAQPRSPLNPLVVRNPRPPAAAPAECEQGLSNAPAPRVQLAEITLPEPPAAVVASIPPPSGTLRSALQDAQEALARNDRPAFDENRTRARALLAAYPAGEERRVAEEISRLHETAARLWDAQYQSPFFGTESPEYALVSRLPGYEEAVRRGTLTDDADHRFYPAAESRQFVTRTAAERLRRLGIRSLATRIGRPVETHATGSEGVHPKPARASKPRVTQQTSSKPKTSSKPRRTTTSTAKTSKPATVKPVPSPPNPSVPPTTAAVPAPAAPRTTPPAAGGLSKAPAPVTTATTAPTATLPDTAYDTPPTTTTVSTTTSEPTDTSLTTAEAVDTAVATDTDTTPVTPPPATRGRSVILPVILILIGLGVLIVLFRASK